MGKRQMPKGYRQRQRDKQLDRWKKYLRKEKKKIEDKNTKPKGVRLEMTQNSQELSQLAEELRQMEINKKRYKGAWEAERKTANAFKEQNRLQRKTIKHQENVIKVMMILITVLALTVIWGILT